MLAIQTKMNPSEMGKFKTYNKIWDIKQLTRLADWRIDGSDREGSKADVKPVNSRD